MSFQISRSESLRNIPQRKLLEALENTIRTCAECSVKKGIKIDAGLCKICSIKNKAIRKYAEANIPVRYWFLEMDHNFYGFPLLKEKYEEVTADIRKTYRDGVSLCFAGPHGTGKSLTCTCIIKRAVEKGYNGLYTKLSDIVATILDHNADGLARKELMVVDFLVIDEFDPRYMSNEKSSDLFGKLLEEIYRTRHENGLPTFMCTNSPNVVESFTGPIKQSIASLMATVTEVPVYGKDARKDGVKNV